MVPVQPAPPPAVPKDQPRAYAAKIGDGGDDDDDDDDVGFEGEYLPQPSRASEVGRVEMEITRAHVAEIENHAIREGCQSDRSRPMERCDALISANRHHVDQPSLTSSFSAVWQRAMWTAFADLPLARRRKVSTPGKKLIPQHISLVPTEFPPSFEQAQAAAFDEHIAQTCGLTKLTPHLLRSTLARSLVLLLVTQGIFRGTIRKATATHQFGQVDLSFLTWRTCHPSSSGFTLR
jgi:hypothetical protein